VRRTSILLGGILVYAASILFVGAITTIAAYRVGATLLTQLAPAAEGQRQIRQVTDGRAARPAPIATSSVARQGAMTPTADSFARWPRDGWPRTRAGDDRWGAGAPFGSSARGIYRPPGYFERLFGEDDDTAASSHGTFRTLCVRLCDGYYWPISFAATRDRLERDAQVCERSCGEQARLFVYRNPGGDIEDMEDLQGRPYRLLRTAFLYRTEYVPTCKCQPHPWEAEARERHRVYTLAAAKRQGDKAAAKELATLAARAAKENPSVRKAAAGSRPPAMAGGLEPGAPLAGADATASLGNRRPWESTEPQKAMRLGVGNRPREMRGEARPSAYRDDDWRRRIFQ
jgi:hypothetical protein